MPWSHNLVLHKPGNIRACEDVSRTYVRESLTRKGIPVQIRATAFIVLKKMAAKIRRMHPRDVKSAVLLYREANQFATERTIEGWTVKNLTEFPEYHLVYCDKDEVLGAISGTIDKTVGTIQDIATLTSMRGHGIGSLLLNTLLDRFKEAGVKKVRLWVHVKSEAAIPFYEHRGFKVIKKERTKGVPDVPDGEQITVLEKNI